MGGFRRAHSPEFKIEAVRQVTEGGRPVSEVAWELAIRPEQLRGWRKQLLASGAITAPALPVAGNVLDRAFAVGPPIGRGARI